MTIGDRVFQPPTLEVATGSTVEWTNADGDTHTVNATDGTFDSGILAPGGTFATTLDAPGSYSYFCAIHSDMQGTITVSDPVAAESPPLDAPASPIPARAAPASEPVSIVDRAFEPVSVEVPVGSTVAWSNAGEEGHTVTAFDGSFDSGIMAPGDAFTATFDAVGAFEYFCAIHGEMRGTITVAASTDPPAASG